MSRKCLVLDLDNTLWGGVIGDDGLNGIALGSGAAGEAFVAFQRFVKALQLRGVILAACSKNEPEVASLPFRDHPDTVLRLEDFAAFQAGWGNKADSVRTIAETLGIGLDALVFVDDNPAEREVVRRHLPEVEVIELPEDPAFFVGALAGARCFEAIILSSEDRERGRYYADNARRSEARARFVDMESYLRDLAMVGRSGEADAFHLPRLVQLINKSNQFHLTGTRYSEAEVAALTRRPGWTVHHFSLRDRFGDNGLISSVVLRKVDGSLHIDTWVMSCRVLGRTMEEFIANEILAVARRSSCGSIVGRYVPSGRNGMVERLYDRLGFTPVTGEAEALVWALALDRQTSWQTAVRREDTT